MRLSYGSQRASHRTVPGRTRPVCNALLCAYCLLVWTANYIWQTCPKRSKLSAITNTVLRAGICIRNVSRNGRKLYSLTSDLREGPAVGLKSKDCKTYGPKRATIWPIRWVSTFVHGTFYCSWLFGFWVRMSFVFIFFLQVYKFLQ